MMYGPRSDISHHLHLLLQRREPLEELVRLSIHIQNNRFHCRVRWKDGPEDTYDSKSLEELMLVIAEEVLPAIKNRIKKA